MKFTGRKKWGAGLLLAALLCLFAPQDIHAGTAAEEMDGVMGQSLKAEMSEDAQDLDSMILDSASRAATASILGASSYTDSFLNNSFTSSALIGNSAYTYYSTYYHKAEYESKELINGIDVSWWQAKSYAASNVNYRKISALDWDKVHSAGIDFAFVRVASRDSSSGTIYEDTCANSHITGALSSGLDVGAYVFSQALTEKEGIEEAQYVLNLIEKYGWNISMPIVIDREAGSYKRLTAGKLSKAKETAVIQAFADTITAAGYRACVYASYSWINNYINTSSLNNCSLWIARYNKTTTSYATSGTAYSDVAYDYEFWQYNVAKSISGYSSNVDLNFWYKDAARTIGDLKVTATTPTTVSLSWSASGSVKGYRIYRYDPSQSAYVYIGETTKKSYKDSGLTSGTSYQYKVCSYWAGDGTDEYSPYTDEVSALTKPSQVQNVRVQSGVQTEVQIAWDSVAEASGYRIYKYNDSAEKYEKVTDVDSSVTSYTFTGLSGATVYDYKVKAYILRDGAYTWGTASDECIYVTNPDAVGSLTAKYKSATSVALKWSKVARATGYQIYRLSMSSGKYEKIAAVKGGSTLTYTNTGLASGTTYSYQVRAYMTEDETDYYGEFSTISSMTTGPAKVGSLKLTAASKSVTLKWSKVSGATGYEIYRLNAKTKKYEKIKTVKGDSTLTWKNTKLTKGTTYKYKVRAYRTYNGTTYYGTCSAIKSVKAK